MNGFIVAAYHLCFWYRQH